MSWLNKEIIFSPKPKAPNAEVLAELKVVKGLLKADWTRQDDPVCVKEFVKMVVLAYFKIKVKLGNEVRILINSKNQMKFIYLFILPIITQPASNYQTFSQTLLFLIIDLFFPYKKEKKWRGWKKVTQSLRNAPS